MSNQSMIITRSVRDNWETCVDTVVLKDEKLSITARGVFALLCVIAGWGHRSCSPSLQEVAKLAGLSESTTASTLKRLEARGVIEYEDEVIYLIGSDAACYEAVWEELERNAEYEEC